jgi:rhomboid protease GluP
MSLTDPAAVGLLEDEGRPADLVEVGVYPSERAGAERGLVVLALGRAYWLEATERGWQLLVEPAMAGRVREQLLKFERESVGWPPRPLAGLGGRVYPTDLITPLLWAAVVMGLFNGQDAHPDWVKKGALDTVAVFDGGEWWRVGTALFLHADGAHVVSNAMMGLLLFIAVLKTFGRALGWVLVAAAALLGNFAVAAIHYPGPYRSLGASTAIFAGLGLLTGRMVRVLLRSDHPHRWRAVFVALGSGAVVFAMYGAGEARVDLGAHLAGFLAGLGVGWLRGDGLKQTPGAGNR